MYYLTNPNLEPNYLEIKKKFNTIKQLDTIVPEINILLSNNRDSCARATFYEQRETYLNKIISIFLIKKKGIEKLVGPVKIDNNDTIEDIIKYINEFVPTDNVYIDIDDQDNLESQISNYYKLRIDNIKLTNIVYS
jgi:hypothetical protein